MAITRYGNNIYEGLSSDTKPTNVPLNSRFNETDTGDVYRWNGSGWIVAISASKIEEEINKTVNSINNILKNLGNNKYEVFKDGSNWYARNTVTGAITSSDTDLTVVLQAAINALTASRTAIETVKVRGVGTHDKITIPSYTRLDLTEASLTLVAHEDPDVVDHMYTNSNHIGGNTQIQIIGGYLDGDRSNQNPYTVSPPGEDLEAANIIHMKNVINPQVIGVDIKNSASRQIRFRDCIDGTMAYNKSDTSNAEAFQARGGSGHNILYNHIKNSLASFITTYECPNCIIEGNHGKDNTGAFSGYNVSSNNTIFRNNIGSNAGSATLTMSEASPEEGSWSIIEGNDLSGSRAAEGISCIGGERTAIIFKGNRLHHNNRHGIRVSALKTAIIISNNICYENGYSGIASNSGAGTLIPSHISIHGNMCFNNGTGASSNDYECAGIALYGTGGTLVENVSIENNHCFDTDPVNANKTQLYGIYLSNTDNCSSTGNNVRGNKTDGLGLANTNNELMVWENLGYSMNSMMATTMGVETLENKTITSPVITGTITPPDTSATHLIIRKPSTGTSAEKILQIDVDDDPNGFLQINNGTSADGAFVAEFLAKQSGFNSCVNYVCQGTTDTGTTPLFLLAARIGTSTAITTRPIFAINNVNTAGRIMEWNPTNLRFYEAYDMKFGTTTGTKIGTTNTEKIGFFGQTPRVQLPFQASPTATTIRDALISLGLMAPS